MGLRDGHSPEAYTDVSRDEVPGPLDFALTFRGVEASTLDDHLFNLTLNVVANDTILPDSSTSSWWCPVQH